MSPPKICTRLGLRAGSSSTSGCAPRDRSLRLNPNLRKDARGFLSSSFSTGEGEPFPGAFGLGGSLLSRPAFLSREGAAGGLSVPARMCRCLLACETAWDGSHVPLALRDLPGTGYGSRSTVRPAANLAAEKGLRCEMCVLCFSSFSPLPLFLLGSLLGSLHSRCPVPLWTGTDSTTGPLNFGALRALDRTFAWQGYS